MEKPAETATPQEKPAEATTPQEKPADTTALKEKPAEATAPKDEKHFVNWNALILWPFVIFILYVLSFGPVMMMWYKGRFLWRGGLMGTLYTPLWWAYNQTLMHKPFGMYLHLWVPQLFDKNGEWLG